jgi:hypothetical protein
MADSHSDIFAGRRESIVNQSADFAGLRNVHALIPEARPFISRRSRMAS